MNQVTPQNAYRECKFTAKTTRENILFLLSKKWAFGFDELQWIIYRWRGTAKGWRPTFFVRSNKGVLMRNIKERGVEVSPQARTTLNRLPDTFAEWFSMYCLEQGGLGK